MSHHQGTEGPIDDQAVIAEGQQTPPAPPTTRRMIRSVLLFTVAGVILYGAAALASDRKVLWSALQQFPGSALFLTMILVCTGWLLRGWRFFFYLRHSGEHVPIGYSIGAFLAGFALTGTPGKVGEAVKGVFLKQDYGVAVTKVMGILVVERLMDLWGVLLLGSVSLLLFTEWKGLFFLCAVLVIAAGVFLCMESLYRPALLWIGRISFLAWISRKLIETLMAGRHLMTPRVFATGLVLSTVAWGLESISLFIILDGFSLSSTILQANFVYCFSTLVGALSMLPGGIGGTEAAMVALLAFMGIPYGRAIPPVILIRLCTLWAAIAVGVIFMVIMTMRSGSPSHSVPGNADSLQRMGSS